MRLTRYPLASVCAFDPLFVQAEDQPALTSSTLASGLSRTSERKQ
ncbi:MAG: hypothetical protein ABIQ20_05990 [Thermomonas sp.]